MIKLKNLLLESPDMVEFDGQEFRYQGTVNRAAFFTYYDEKDNINGYFGYSDINKNFFCDRDEVIEEINIMKNMEDNEFINPYEETAADFRYKINYLLRKNNGGGHEELKSILDSTSRLTITRRRARLFEVPDATGKKHFIMTFWSGKDKIKENKQEWDECLKKSGVDPKIPLYQISSYEFVTYDQVYDIPKQGDVLPKVVETEISKELKRKNDELIQALSDLHVRGATLTTDAKEMLKEKTILLQAEVDILTKAKEEGKNDLKDVDLKIAILNAIHNKPKTAIDLRNAILGQIENKFPGLSYAQIKQMLSDKGISLKSITKEYKMSRKKLNETLLDKPQ